MPKWGKTKTFLLSQPTPQIDLEIYFMSSLKFQVMKILITVKLEV